MDGWLLMAGRFLAGAGAVQESRGLEAGRLGGGQAPGLLSPKVSPKHGRCCWQCRAVVYMMLSGCHLV